MTFNFLLFVSIQKVELNTKSVKKFPPERGSNLDFISITKLITQTKAFDNNQ